MWAFNDLSCQWLAVTPNNALEWTAGSVWPRYVADIRTDTTTSFCALPTRALLS